MTFSLAVIQKNEPRMQVLQRLLFLRNEFDRITSSIRGLAESKDEKKREIG